MPKSVNLNLIICAILTIRIASAAPATPAQHLVGDTLPDYNGYPAYSGADLGLHYSPSSSVFRIWAPTAGQARLYLYANDSSETAGKVVDMKKDRSGSWLVSVPGDWKNWRYVFSVQIGGVWSRSVPDPYARAAGVNGKRAAVLDPDQVNPPGWQTDQSPAYSAANRPADAVICELHLRDIDEGSQSGVKLKGKFGGLGEWATHTEDGQPTSLAYLKELGVTHLHILPMFDFNSIDESRPDSTQYNWGYDPLNYNVPEGSYSTNPYDAAARIRELKSMIQSIHRHGLRVIMDVVYNHTGLTGTSCFNELVPGYYYRHNPDNSFSNATGCGNETASERPMFRKFMLESVLYWMKEYHLDGFRFDLMGVHDITTMNLIADSLRRLRPDIVLYGEGWTAGHSPLPDSVLALKRNVARLHGIAAFGDDLRDGIKGSVFDAHDKGFVAGNVSDVESVKFGITGACFHPQVDYSKVNYSHAAFATAPSQVISYCECHDNNTLWDKLALSAPEASMADREKMQRLAWTIVLTSQGIPFLFEGTELLHSKRGIDNSFQSGDSINEIDWGAEKDRLDDVRYLRTLIQMRRDHPAFRMTSAAQIAKNIHFEPAPAGCIGYTIDGSAMHDRWSRICIVLNGTAETQSVALPAGAWQQVLPGPSGPTVSGTVTVGGHNAVILYR